MSKGSSLKYLIPLIKARLNADLTAVEIIGGTVAVPCYEFSSEYNRGLPRVVIGDDTITTPQNTAQTFGDDEDIHLDVYSSSENQGIFELESIVDAVLRSLIYRLNCGTPYDDFPEGTPQWQVIGVDLQSKISANDPETTNHRKIIIVRYMLNQVA